MLKYDVNVEAARIDDLVYYKSWLVYNLINAFVFYDYSIILRPCSTSAATSLATGTLRSGVQAATSVRTRVHDPSPSGFIFIGYVTGTLV